MAERAAAVALGGRLPGRRAGRERRPRPRAGVAIPPLERPGGRRRRGRRPRPVAAAAALWRGPGRRPRVRARGRGSRGARVVDLVHDTEAGRLTAQFATPTPAVRDVGGLWARAASGSG